MRRHLHLSFLPALIALAACSTPDVDPNISDALGSCVYVNSFSDVQECREFYGSDWTVEAMTDQCDAPVPGADPGVLTLDTGCEVTELLGQCIIDEGTVESSIIVFPGDVEGASCNGLAVGCSFAGGEFVPAAACGGEDPLPPVDYVPFQPPHLNCVDPLPGEPAGDGPDGQVCTWEVINGSTEEGRYFADYASCDAVLTQRPYYGAPEQPQTDADDPRLGDKEFLTELEWVTEQVEASACVCCHSNVVAPDGASGWYLEVEGIWTDTLDDDATAMMAGWIDSTAFGAYPAPDNNGFSRKVTGVPTTDTDRMLAFWEDELARRGLTPEDFADAPPFGGPLADQLVYEPTDCRDGQGIAADGTISWTGGAARYVYVLEGDSNSPGVPPNLDLPLGTQWRFDVAPEADAVSQGIRYGAVPEGATQQWPLQGAAPELVPGQEYYLYVLYDIAQPLTRCLFEAE